jgi:M6 family metalloprotease-like protein
MRPRSRTALLAAALGGVLAVPSGAAGTAAPAGELVGTYQVLSVDNPPGSVEHGREQHALVTDDGRVVPLSVSARAGAEPGSRVLARGDRTTAALSTGRLEALGSTTTTSTSFSAANGSTGTTRTLAVLARWGAPDTVTPTGAHAVLFGTGRTWWSEVSYGKLSHTGDVTPWLVVPKPTSSVCSLTGVNQLAASARAAADAAYDLTRYQRTLVYITKADADDWANCAGVAGTALIGGNVSVINGHLTAAVTAHEQGHNYGLSHAQTFKCTSGAAGGTCTVPAGPAGEYGDLHDPMGKGASTHFHAAHKAQLGWLGTRAVPLTASGSTVRLVPSATIGGTGPVAAYVTVGARKYWFEYRTRINKDATLGTGATGGVLVHLVDRNISTDNVGLLDMTPDNNWSSPVLPNGASWQAPEGFFITVTSASATGVTVTRRAAAVTRRATALTASGTSVAEVTYPNNATIRTRLVTGTTGVVGQSLSLWVRKRGATAWSHVRNVTTVTGGYATTAHSPLWHADYQWRYAGDPSYTGSTGATVQLNSRARATSVFDRTTMVRGSTAKLSGTMRPARSGATVYIQQWSGSKWNNVGTITMGTSEAYAVQLRLGSPGTYQLRVYLPTNVDRYGAVSTKATLKVT